MNNVARRLATTALGAQAALAAWAITSAAAASLADALGVTRAGRPLALLAMLWLLLLGLGVRSVLRRQRRCHDRLTATEARLDMERRTRLHAARALPDSASGLCHLPEQREQVRQQERLRIARDIHDDLGQYLLTLKIDLTMLQARTDDLAPAAQATIVNLRNTLDLSIASLRSIIDQLRPPALEHGLHAAIDAQLAAFSRVSGIDCHLHADAAVFAAHAGGQFDTLLLRVVQEALANVTRHAHATEASVALTHAAGQLTLQVRDNGVGMAGPDAAVAAAAGAGVSVGLRGIAERAAQVGGRVAIDSRPGAGTTLTLMLPLRTPIPTIAGSLAKYQSCPHCRIAK